MKQMIFEWINAIAKLLTAANLSLIDALRLHIELKRTLPYLQQLSDCVNMFADF